jgi:hypothetical protein
VTMVFRSWHSPHRRCRALAEGGEGDPSRFSSHSYPGRRCDGARPVRVGPAMAKRTQTPAVRGHDIRIFMTRSTRRIHCHVRCRFHAGRLRGTVDRTSISASLLRQSDRGAAGNCQRPPVWCLGLSEPRRPRRTQAPLAPLP